MLNQPRKGFEDNSAGILNVSVEDITTAVSTEVKRRVLTESNKCAVLGKRNNAEYATLVNSETGEVVPGCELKEGGYGMVDISDWSELLRNSPAGEFDLIHNHNNDTTFSIEDIEVFVNNKSINGMFVASGKRLGYISKQSPGVFDFPEIQESLKSTFRSNIVNSAGDMAEEWFKTIYEALPRFDIKVERW